MAAHLSDSRRKNGVLSLTVMPRTSTTPALGHMTLGPGTVAGTLNFSRACGARIEIRGLSCACLISKCPWEIEAESACEFLNPDF